MKSIVFLNQEIKYNLITNSHQRRCDHFKNKIYESLSKIGLDFNSVETSEQIHPLSNQEAFAEWSADGFDCKVACNVENRYVDNMQIIASYISQEVQKIMDDEIELHEFLQNCEDKEE